MTLAHLDALAAKATPRPWMVVGDGIDGGEHGYEVVIGYGDTGALYGMHRAESTAENWEHDGPFIAALVNAWPKIRAALIEAEDIAGGLQGSRDTGGSVSYHVLGAWGDRLKQALEALDG